MLEPRIAGQMRLPVLRPPCEQEQLGMIELRDADRVLPRPDAVDRPDLEPDRTRHQGQLPGGEARGPHLEDPLLSGLVADPRVLVEHPGPEVEVLAVFEPPDGAT